MPGGGRHPGAGAPKGNFNGLKGGAYSRRMRFALAALVSMHRTGDQAHRDFTDLMLAATRLLYDRPVNDELRALLVRASFNHSSPAAP